MERLTTEEKLQEYKTLELGDFLVCINDYAPIGSYIKYFHRGKYCEVRRVDRPGGSQADHYVFVSEKIGGDYGPALLITPTMFVNYFTTLADYTIHKSYYENLNIPLEQEGESEDTMEVLAQDAISEFTPILKTLHKFIEMWKNKGIELQYDPTVSRFFKIKFTNNTDFPREAVIDLEESNNKSEDNVNG
jgi:hypothetical protein